MYGFTLMLVVYIIIVCFIGVVVMKETWRSFDEDN